MTDALQTLSFEDRDVVKCPRIFSPDLDDLICKTNLAV
jgi:hypothetical protein